MKRTHYMFLFLFILVLTTIGIWIAKIVRGDLPYVDEWTRPFVDTFPDTFIYTFFRLVTNLGSEPFMYPFTAVMAILIWWLYKHWLPALIFAGGTFFSHQVNKLIKTLVNRDRPSILIEANAEGHSFPSGHAMITLVCYGMIAYFISKKIASKRVALWFQVSISILIFLIGISRYFINVHYLTDIVAGFVFGFICFIGMILIYEWIEKRRTRSKV
ncbi:phosphatase PAP2 family protein [Ornithinibacillus halophilus]|uniref:Undecaprenyl-diphosphatase n=1 Tax=Ornithinibacillus halophilus TaxID=930117 RepID=A0A1M5MAE0_9BACI|nr:phosphatase PAP2 family protein [Ornithinibacillus halophilus]SHG73653.1 undecaprenyl-diphosphatase [Ornithinibacillus halophilus]